MSVKVVIIDDMKIRKEIEISLNEKKFICSRLLNTDLNEP
jgi:hypothetical protein